MSTISHVPPVSCQLFLPCQKLFFYHFSALSAYVVDCISLQMAIFFFLHALFNFMPAHHLLQYCFQSQNSSSPFFSDHLFGMLLCQSYLAPSLWQHCSVVACGSSGTEKPSDRPQTPFRSLHISLLPLASLAFLALFSSQKTRCPTSLSSKSSESNVL